MPGNVPSASWRARVGAWFAQIGAAGWIAVAVCVLGLALRVEHALTFDGPNRGADYGVYVLGVRWMLQHHRPFDFDPSVNFQVRYQPPLWYALAAVVLRVTGSERAISGLSVGGWVVRQFLLAKILRDAIPARKWSRTLALALGAVFPLSVLVDGNVNPEGPNATLFMVAVYFLWRMERQAETATGISSATAVLFGLVAGLAVLTKSTSVILMLGATVVLLWIAGRWVRREGWGRTVRRFLGPAFVGAAVWCLVVGWWCWPNYQKYGRPFPHSWDVTAAAHSTAAAVPILYRRPLGWALPFEWQYLSFPIIRSPAEPRPNFWGVAVAGSWADFYNRGFCRLQGGGFTDRVWGGDHGFMHRGRGGLPWDVSSRCVGVFVALVRIGVFLSLAAVVAVFYTAWRYVRSRGRDGSLVLPTMAVLGVLFIMAFALVYPFDGSAVLNPRYFLPATTPMIACFGFWHARLRNAPRRYALLAWLAYVLSFVAIAGVAALLVFERFGR